MTRLNIDDDLEVLTRDEAVNSLDEEWTAQFMVTPELLEDLQAGKVIRFGVFGEYMICLYMGEWHFGQAQD